MLWLFSQRFIVLHLSLLHLSTVGCENIQMYVDFPLCTNTPLYLLSDTYLVDVSHMVVYHWSIILYVYETLLKMKHINFPESSSVTSVEDPTREGLAWLVASVTSPTPQIGYLSKLITILSLFLSFLHTQKKQKNWWMYCFLASLYVFVLQMRWILLHV